MEQQIISAMQLQHPSPMVIDSTEFCSIHKKGRKWQWVLSIPT